MPRVVFVAATGRSGSTIFELALAQRLGVPSTGELASVWTRGVLEGRRCSCGAAFAACDFWQAVVATDADGSFTRTSARHQAEGLARVLRASGPLRCLTAAGRDRLVGVVDPRWNQAMAALYRGVATVGTSATFTDSSKAPALAYLLSRIDGVQVDVVHLVRDPRSVARSWSQPHDVTPDTAPMPRLVPWKSALVWAMVNEAAARVGSVASGRELLVRYEDFARAPRVVLEHVARSLDFPASPTEGGALQVAPAAHTMSGNPPVRLSRRPHTVGSVQSSPATLSPVQRRLVSALTLPWLGHYGYPLRAEGASPPVPSAV